MFRFLLLLQLVVLVASRARFPFDEEIFEDLFEQNDPNLNPGFDLNGFRQNQLDLHNYYRSLHGVALMSRDETLTTQAQEYAETLAAKNAGLEHCANVVGCQPDGAGENLAFAGGSTSTETNATKAWYDEIWDYNFCYKGFGTGSQRPGHEGKAVGHFTQVVWEGSTLLGIGYARNADRTKVYVVARYKPAGNVQASFRNFYQENVKVPAYILDTFQNNCDGTNGGLTNFMGPGSCTRSCGGGIQFLTKTCTNPKPSLNGADCVGETKQLAAREWCNTHSCPGNQHHRDLQCAARGYTAQHTIFGGSSECTLHCLLGGNTYTSAGFVDDGTHCNSDAGACVNGLCQAMPKYVPGAPPSTAAPDTTTREPETTTTEPETTTMEPETTTMEPETTTMEPETTTTEPETTTTEPETTTMEPETTTMEPETTTTEPEITTMEPETTTMEPETTTTEPETTTMEPETTTMEPETTTTEPETTTMEPETTTTEPETTTTEPETTTMEPETTTMEPETTTTEPERTTTEPETTTMEPETTTTEPETTTTEPEKTTTEPETTTMEPKTTTEPETTTTRAPETTPSPTPARRLVRGRRYTVAVTRRVKLIVKIPSGGSNILLYKLRYTIFHFVYRFKKVENGKYSRWRTLRCSPYRRSCRIRGPIPAGYQVEIGAYASHVCRRVRIRGKLRLRCSRRRRRYRVSVYYHYYV